MVIWRFLLLFLLTTIKTKRRPEITWINAGSFSFSPFFLWDGIPSSLLLRRSIHAARHRKWWFRRAMSACGWGEWGWITLLSCWQGDRESVICWYQSPRKRMSRLHSWSRESWRDWCHHAGIPTHADVWGKQKAHLSWAVDCSYCHHGEWDSQVGCPLWKRNSIGFPSLYYYNRWQQR